MSKRKHHWFLEPKDDWTKEVLEKNLGKENYFENVLCFDGKTRNFFQCLYDNILFLWRTREGLKIDFEVFSKELPNGKIRNCTVIFRDEGKKKSVVAKRNYYRNLRGRF